MKSIPALERQKREVHALFAQVDAALVLGKITQRERDAYLEHKFGSTNEQEIVARIDRDLAQLRHADDALFTHKSTMMVTGFALFMLSLFVLLLTSTGGITGAVTQDTREVGQTYTQNFTFTIEANTTNKVYIVGNVSGVGDVLVSARSGTQAYVVYEYHGAGASTAHASLEKRQYGQGEEVAFVARNVSSAYLMTSSEAILLGNETVVRGLDPGNYSIKLLIEDVGLSQEELPFTVVSAGTAEMAEEMNACGDACHVNISGNITFDIALTGTASITLTKIVLVMQTNRAPVQQIVVPDMTGEQVVVDLRQIFADPDEDALVFSSSHYDENNETIENGILTITGVPGTYTYVAYASDQEEMSSSNLFTVTMQSPSSQEVNASTEQRTNASNATLNESGIIADEPVLNITPVQNTTLDTLNCSDPDPNRRDAACLNLEGQRYFEEDVFLENVDREKMARITPIGNILITGRIVKYDATSSPGARDYTIGYKDGDFVYHPTIWVDGEGNLHLRGTLHEENENIVPPGGSYAIINRRGVYLAYAIPETGDLYVRGNVIPYREDIYA